MANPIAFADPFMVLTGVGWGSSVFLWIGFGVSATGEPSLGGWGHFLGPDTAFINGVSFAYDTKYPNPPSSSALSGAFEWDDLKKSIEDLGDDIEPDDDGYYTVVANFKFEESLEPTYSRTLKIVGDDTGAVTGTESSNKSEAFIDDIVLGSATAPLNREWTFTVQIHVTINGQIKNDASVSWVYS